MSREYAIMNSELNSLTQTAAQRQALYEDLIDENGQLVQNIHQLEEKLRIQERKAERHDSEMEKLTQASEKQKKELEEARQMLKDGPPDLAKLEDNRSEISSLQEKAKVSEEKIKARTEEHDYMCGEYQKHQMLQRKHMKKFRPSRQ